MKDWISLPKSNGYESLHATVMGPGNKWVEVQFRSRRMDLVAEKGLAAHWRYKGSQGRQHRPVDEQYPRHPRKRRQRPDAADEEPQRRPAWQGSIRLHSQGETFSGSPEEPRCSTSPSTSTPTSARIVPERLSTGRINALTTRFRMETQSRSSPPPTSSHVRNGSIVNSTKARNKIKQSLNEEKQRLANDIGKETLMRRAKNRKLELDDAVMMRLIKSWDTNSCSTSSPTWVKTK